MSCLLAPHLMSLRPATSQCDTPASSQRHPWGALLWHTLDVSHNLEPTLRLLAAICGLLSADSALTRARLCLYSYAPARAGVGVAQLAEHWIVAPVVAGSNPVAHPL